MPPKRPPLPREHGAWAMLVLPLVLGALAARTVTAASLLILPATVLLFLARFAPMGGTRARRRGAGRPPLDPGRLTWSVIYLAASAACLAAAVALAPPDRRPAAVAIAAVTGALGTANAVLVLAGKGRSAGAELLAMSAVALTAPLVLVLAGHPAGGLGAGLAVLCLAYFLSTMSFVRAFRVLGEPEAAPRAVVGCLVTHALLVVGLAAAWKAGWIPVLLLAAFVPVLARTLVGLMRPPRSLAALGRREIGVSVTLLALAGVALLGGTPG
ncbi:MAG TPA: YwiC-like family protein [bacterium]|nr:YwiC-like family protein [bacterium]